MMDQHVEAKKDGRLRCECCAGGHLDVRFMRETIDHENEDGTIVVEAERVPFHVCDSCGSVFVTAETARARHEYVCRAIGVITPAEIRAIRERHRFSQAEFARITNLGVASLSRWESGRLLPSSSHSTYLRLLLDNPSNVDRLVGNMVGSGIQVDSPVPPPAGKTVRKWHMPNRMVENSRSQAVRFAFAGMR